MEIIPQVDSDGTQYYQLKARVTTGLSTPCPERIHVYYYYPQKNFVNQPPEPITKGCNVCLNVQVCKLLFPEEAIIASHKYPGTEAVGQFIKDNADAKADVSFDNADTWTVRWSSSAGAADYVVALSKSQNKVLSVSQEVPIGGGPS